MQGVGRDACSLPFHWSTKSFVNNHKSNMHKLTGKTQKKPIYSKRSAKVMFCRFFAVTLQPII